MNIFLFDEDLEKNAKYFLLRDPKRFNKQIVESMQLFAASMKHYFNISIEKADGTPYIVNRILHHPACKWLLKDIRNHTWHVQYLYHLLLLKPNHACAKSFIKSGVIRPGFFKYPEEYLCITNSDISGLPENATVFDKYKRHLDNKLSKNI